MEVAFDLTITTDNVTKEEILKRVSEESIFEHYGVPIKKGLFCSKLRNDKNPTCGFFRNKKGRLMLKDFGDGSCRDCFAYVEDLFGVSYYLALRIIANDFHIKSNSNLKVNKAKIEPTGIKFQETTQAQIQVEVREFNEQDLNWWKQYGISKETLKKFKVYACKTVWLNGNIFYVYNQGDHVYGYFGGIKDGIELWRIYHAGRKKYKFVSNWKSIQIQGSHMLPKDGGDYLVVTKSMKDVMCLYEYGITAIAPCSENLFLTNSQYEKLKKKFRRIYLTYDTDLAGIHNMNKIRKQYPDIIPLMIPRSIGCKDISDVRRYRGDKFTLDLINQAKSYYEEEKASEFTGNEKEEDWSI